MIFYELKKWKLFQKRIRARVEMRVCARKMSVLENGKIFQILIMTEFGKFCVVRMRALLYDKSRSVRKNRAETR